MNKIKKTIEFLTKKDVDENLVKMCRTHFIASLIMAATALIMTIQNIRVESWTMAWATGIMTVGFLINLLVAGLWKNYRVSTIIIIVLVGFLLSAFILGGGNEGFACLWVLIVPMVAVPLLGVIPGVSISLYFFVFIFVLFYSPLNYLIINKYTTAHMQRFPILYGCTMLLALFATLQKEFYVRKLREKSFYDELTGAYNRNFFLDQIEKADIINGKDFSVIAIDVNGLKAANDTLGHAGGDELLVGLVDVCKEAFGKNVNIFRMGGDEFTIILNKPRSEVKFCLNKLRKARDAWEGKLNEKLRFAIGYASKSEFPEYAPEDLMHVADERMYLDKADFYAYNNRRKDENNFPRLVSDTTKIMRRSLIRKGLRQSIANGFKGFEIYYQPMVSPDGSKIMGCEALLRWADELVNDSSPFEFIQILEESGDIIEVGRYVMQESIKQLREWQDKYGDIFISFNVSYLQFLSDGYTQELVDFAKSMDVNPSSLIIELTESCKVHSPERLSAIFHELRSYGFNIALDDFGTGYSSLETLKILPCDSIKIDHNFVRDLTKEGHDVDFAIIRSILTLCQELNLSVIVEGIESKDVAEIIRELPVGLLQGYYYSEPICKEKFEKLLTEEQPFQVNA